MYIEYKRGNLLIYLSTQLNYKSFSRYIKINKSNKTLEQEVAELREIKKKKKKCQL